MKFEFVLDDTLIDDVMSNFPEAGMCLTCVDFRYKNCRFQFWDHEVTPATANPSIVPAKIETLKLSRSGLVNDAVTYWLGRPELEAGMQILVDKILAGKLKGLGLTKKASQNSN